MRNFVTYFIMLFICVYGLIRCTYATKSEKELIKKLLSDYEELGLEGRPVIDAKDNVTVTIRLSLHQILDLNEQEQVLTSNLWLGMSWKDQYLVWDPAEYGSIEVVRIPISKLWIPDIVLYNFVEPAKFLDNQQLVLYHTGDIKHLPAAIYKSSCLIDNTYFPYDQQTCSFIFGSWAYADHELDLEVLKQDAFDTSDYVESQEWAVVNISTERVAKMYSCCSDIYVTIKFSVTLQRASTFYKYTLAIPSVLLSAFTLMSFLIPPESDSRKTFGISVFVSFFVLLLMLGEIMPPIGTKMPLLGSYFCVNMILITVSSFLSLIVIYIYNLGTTNITVPKFLHKGLIDKCGMLLCIGKEKKIQHYDVNISYNNSMSPSVKDISTDDENDNTKTLNSTPSLDNQRDNARDWLIIARILDILFFVAYVVVIICALCVYKTL